MGRVFLSSGQISETEHTSRLGTTIAVSAIFAANVYTGLLTQSWTLLATIFIIFSALSGFIWTGVYSLFPYLLSGIFQTTLATANFWMCFLLIQVLCLGPRYLYDFVQKTYNPRDVDIIRERLVYGMLSDDLEAIEDPKSNLSEKQHESLRPALPPRWETNASTYTLQDEVVASQAPLRQRMVSENSDLNMESIRHEQFATAQEHDDTVEYGYALSQTPSRADSFVSIASFQTALHSPAHR